MAASSTPPMKGFPFELLKTYTVSARCVRRQNVRHCRLSASDSPLSPPSRPRVIPTQLMMPSSPWYCWHVLSILIMPFIVLCSRPAGLRAWVDRAALCVKYTITLAVRALNVERRAPWSQSPTGRLAVLVTWFQSHGLALADRLDTLARLGG